MKKNKLLIGVIAAFALVGCGSITSSTCDDSSVNSTSSISEVTSETSSENTSILELSTNEIFTGIQIGGTLMDISIGRWLCVGLEYKNTIEFSGLNDQTARIESSHPENIEVTNITSNGEFTLVAKKAGDSIIKIYDKDGVLHYRNVIKARNKLTPEQAVDFLIDTDHFDAYGLNGASKLTFLTDTNGIFSGKDGYSDVGNVNFTYEYHGVSSYTGDEYEFTITEWTNEATDLVCTTFYLDFTGCMLHLMTPNVTVDIYYPAN